MFASERQGEILIQLNGHGSIKSTELAEYFQVSLATIRRDLEEMQEKGLLRRVHGGAVGLAVNRKVEDQYFQNRADTQWEKKQAIGKAAAELVKDGETVYLDIGTTVLEIARNLHDKKRLTVITSSLPVLNELADTEVRVYSVGGRLRPKERALVGMEAQETLRKFCVDKAFVSVGGVSIGNGLTDYNYDSASLKKQAIDRARESILVTDSSKFGNDVFAVICGIEDMNTVVTDKDIPGITEQELRNMNIRLIITE